MKTLLTLYVLLASSLFSLYQIRALEPANKLDGLLGEEDKKTAVFVRMRDQLFDEGENYEQFCVEQPPATKRLELRNQVIQQLKQKSDESYMSASEVVKRLKAAGKIRNLKRYWIVNGFACEATGSACLDLASIEQVDFIYQQHFAPQHRTPPATLTDKDTATSALYRELLTQRG